MMMERFHSPAYLLGWRSWEQKDGWLESFRSHLWESKDETAICRRGREGTLHKPPDPNCHCGLYAVKRPDKLWYGSWRNPDRVIGLVAMSGTVIDGPKGMRAEKMSMVALWAPYGTEALADRYGVPVFDDPFEFRRRCQGLLEKRRQGDGPWAK